MNGFGSLIVAASLSSLLGQGSDPFTGDESSSELTRAQQYQQADEAQQREAPSTAHDTHVGSPLSNADLPPHLKAEKGQLTLFADFENAEEGGVPLPAEGAP